MRTKSYVLNNYIGTTNKSIGVSYKMRIIYSTSDIIVIPDGGNTIFLN